MQPEYPLEQRMAETTRRLETFRDGYGEQDAGRAFAADLANALVTHLPDAVASARRSGDAQALDVQFADAYLDTDDGGVLGRLLTEFGAHITPTDGSAPVPLSVGTMRGAFGASNIAQQDFPEGRFGMLPPGSMRVKDPGDSSQYLIAETEIEGVRLVIEGAGRDMSLARAMLLVRVDDAGDMPLPEQRVLARQSWTELFGREPQARPSAHHTQNVGDAMRRGDDDLLAATAAWQPSPKPGVEIMVTPTRLADQPKLAEPEAQIAAIDQLVTLTRRYEELVRHGRLTPDMASGTLSYGLSIVTEMMQMSPAEIARCQEALGDVLSYAEMVMAPSPSRAAVFAEQLGVNALQFQALTEDIRGTWELPPAHLSADTYAWINWTQPPSFADPSAN
jgi:hypothetical protein